MWVGGWRGQQDKVDKAKAMLQRVRERQWSKKNKHRVPASYQEGDWVLVHHSRLPAWPRSTSDDPYFGPYKILSVDGHRITMRCSPRLGRTLVCAAQQLKRYYDPEDLCGEEWELNDEEIAALDLQGAASPMEVEVELKRYPEPESVKSMPIYHNFIVIIKISVKSVKIRTSYLITECREDAAVAPPVVACSVDCDRRFYNTIFSEVKTETLFEGSTIFSFSIRIVSKIFPRKSGQPKAL